MYLPLRELGEEWLLPGVAAVPPNTIALVRTDAAFVEAYMVGLNHEMARELLWRGFPTDQRGTIFRRFWDTRGAVPTPAVPVPQHDIPPIHTWRWGNRLGRSLQAGSSAGPTVLLLRGDLLRRYPLATIFLQRAQWKTDAQGNPVRHPDGREMRVPVPLNPTDQAAWEANTRFPVFGVRLDPDLTFLGFPLSPDEVRGQGGDAGWFVVFQEQPTAPRFGLSDANGQPAAPAGWADLTWAHVSTTGARYVAVAETSGADVPGTSSKPADLAFTPAWDGRADTLAAIFLKRAFRMFLHGDDLLTT
jgi:hypothetical protein